MGLCCCCKDLSIQDEYQPSVINKTMHMNRGLDNIGNTCYLNSVLQCLLKTKPFIELINKNSSTSQKNLINTLNRFLNQYNKENTQLKKPLKQIKQAISNKNPQFQDNSQKDSGQLILTVNNIIQDELKDLCKDASHQSIKKHPLEGKYQTTYKCQCSYKFSLDEKFIILYLNVPNTNKTIQSCIGEFQQSVKIQWKCTACNMEEQHDKTMKIETNQVLIICLKKFDMTDKLNTSNVDLKEDLYIQDQNKQKKKYKLYGIINHFGSMFSGHYTSVCYDDQQKIWFQFNDLIVTKKGSSFSRQYAKDAYILFYKQAKQYVYKSI